MDATHARDIAEPSGGWLTGSCGSRDCGQCTDQTDDPALCDEGPYRGWAMAGVSAAYFLLPIALAMVGAVAGRQRPLLQVLAGAGGLALGMAIAALAGRIFTRLSEVDSA